LLEGRLSRGEDDDAVKDMEGRLVDLFRGFVLRLAGSLIPAPDKAEIAIQAPRRKRNVIPSVGVGRASEEILLFKM
jgi:hypothetical protein